MKTIIAVIAVFTGLFFFESCSTDDLETPVRQETVKNPYDDAMVKRDSISKEDELGENQENQIDPPTLPPIKP